MLLSIFEGIKSMAIISDSYVTWALSIVAASIAAIVSTSYIKPEDHRSRYMYLLFIPGWVFLSLSIYKGSQISLRTAAAAFKQENREILLEIGYKINTALSSQLAFFKWGLLFFGLWLCMYLIWWISAKWNINQ